ncbi:MAG TPA: glycosyl hydrolase family 18 protein [Clostridiales bacterium]|nr:glycosyl hydrolase family 18 protein [Clostridiales bacterium]
MNIHTVGVGESLWLISQRYNIPYQSIAAANAIPPPYNLVVGQSLFIPQAMQTHVVRRGESLWSIARLYNSSVETIRSVNNIPESGIIYPGQVLVIPVQSKQYGQIQVNAYIEPTGNTTVDLNNLEEEAAPHLTYLSIFSYRVLENGSLIPPQNDNELIAAAKSRGIALLMVITNFRGGTFDTALADVILKDTGTQDVLISNILSTMKQKGFTGLNIDFERVPPEDRDLYTEFVKKVRDRIKPEGYNISVALAPKTSATQVGAWYEAHDYGGLGSVADFAILMTYEWGWSGGPPLPVAPINEVRKVLDYAVSVIPRNKIMMGIPLYGYDWVLPYNPKNQFARRISPLQAVERALQFGSRIQYDTVAQSPFYRYYDANGTEHIVWFEDSRSIYAKFRMVHEYNLLGISYWVLGSRFPQNWLILEDLFNVQKLI